MNDHAQRTLSKGHRQEEGLQRLKHLSMKSIFDVPAQDLDEIFEEREDIHARVSRARGRAPAAAIPAAIDPGMWLNMVKVKTPYLADLELKSMKNYILDYKRYSQRCPQQMLSRMQQFILEVICDEEGIAWEEVQDVG